MFLSYRNQSNQLIYTANQLPGFYTRETLALNGLKIFDMMKKTKEVYLALPSTAQKMKIPLGISSVNVTKSAVNFGFGHI